MSHSCYDIGYGILCIPRSLKDRAVSSGNLSGYEAPVPVKYVLTHGYERFDDYLIVDVLYDPEFGVTVDDEYTEY